MSSKSKMADFWISGGVLTRCNCKGGDIVLPDTITGCDSVPFMGVMEPFRLTLSGKMKCNIGDLLSEQITVLNIPAGTQFECSSCGPGHTSFYKKLEEINVDPDNP